MIRLVRDVDTRDVTAEIRNVVSAALDAVLAEMQRQATDPPPVGAPRDTGTLANSIGYMVSVENGNVVGVFGTIVKPVHYDVYQEYGTRRIKPKAFLRRAWERWIPQLPRLISSFREA
ncbi:HK97 gp10 family phage protein (plasmid) [Thermomicrobium sp. 4228-Ro]|uniref:HK97 gp10 family phage protein n=1 Tax=Thermomicrobium sp. 4228-Ro TaxID=2993937 RepID=UPI002248DA35|nr:HK97 gp10 family phage protein [Thermomicrobium sp. 4228-Ro]MCX2728552.1 HK97 gp10 family phage protein [Thermomicrobium sp. 4228-Ro]